MSKNYMNDSQASEIMKFISDTMKLPLIGAGGGFAPLGFYGFSCDYVLTPPQGWLFADGSIYNIADYPEYAALLASQHGRANIYGGDGVTTFATKDLRGEFLRGWGQNSHKNQGNGGEIGKHQNATQHPYSYTEPSNGALIYGVGAKNMTDLDTVVTGVGYNAFNGTIQHDSNINKFYTSRPTNTSVAFFVKATLSDAEINAFNVYTPREHQVAWWEEEIDGVWKRKPVYEKVVNFGALPSNTTKNVQHGIDDIEDFVRIQCMITHSTNGYSTERIISVNNLSNQTAIGANKTNCTIETKSTSFTAYSAKFTLRYTKTTDDWQTS